jgi:hypothetical protein
VDRAAQYKRHEVDPRGDLCRLPNYNHRIFLTLNQGTTNLVNDLGQREAQKRMLDVANKTRMLISDLATAGFVLNNEISLGGGGWLARNYEIGTIAHMDLGVNELPSDERMNELLQVVLDAYDRAVDVPPPEPQSPAVTGDEPPPTGLHPVWLTPA